MEIICILVPSLIAIVGGGVGFGGGGGLVPLGLGFWLSGLFIEICPSNEEVIWVLRTRSQYRT